MQSPIYSKLT